MLVFGVVNAVFEEATPMEAAPTLQVQDDFAYLLTFLPEGWEAKAKELGALRRCRKVPDAATLLRVLLIHLAEGCSLRQTAVRAKHGGLIDLSDVAIMERLRLAGEWFRWMAERLLARWMTPPAEGLVGAAHRLRLVDGSQVKEPGPTGSLWRLHYALELPSLRADELHLTPAKGKGCGETFSQFRVQPGDLLLGDRGYGMAPGIAHVAAAGGDVLVRFGWNNLPLYEADGGAFDLFGHLGTLRGTALGDWPVLIEHEDAWIEGRVCALKKSRQAAEAGRQRAREAARKHGHRITPETLEAAGYVFVFTTVAVCALRASQALLGYRGRWQVELAFKRLKSLLGLGHLPKNDPQAAQAWLYGKLLVALLVETLVQAAESFSPWGYRLDPQEEAQSLLVAGDAVDAASSPEHGQPDLEPAPVRRRLGPDRLRPARDPEEAAPADGDVG